MKDKDKGEEEYVNGLIEMRHRIAESETPTKQSCGEEVERKWGAEVLWESEEKFRVLVANIPDVIWTTDEQGKTTFISPNVEKVYGYTPEEIYRASNALWLDRIHPDDVETVAEAYESLFVRNQMFDVEYRIQRKDEGWIWIHDRAIISYKKDGVMYADDSLERVLPL